MHWVLDTNVLISALIWKGEPRILLELEHFQHIPIVTAAQALTRLQDLQSR